MTTIEDGPLTPGKLRVRLIHNPSASTTNDAVRATLEGLLDPEVELSVVGTRERDHATELALDAVRDGVDAVFVLGGDGTTNEVLQGLAGSNIPLGLVPGGGTNVLARALGLPNDARAAAEIQLQELLAGRSRPLGLGEANGRLFGFQAGIGFDAAVVRRVEDHPGMKRWLRQVAFVLLGLREWAINIDRRDPAIEVHGVAGLDGPRMMVVAGNVDPYTYLGPRALRLTPDAGPTTGLELLAVRPVSTWGILRALGRAFARADHVRDDAIDVAHDLSEVELRCTRPVDLMVDGDHIGTHEVVRLRYRPDAVLVLAPASAIARRRTLRRTHRAA